MSATYDRIGATYATYRQPDPRIAAAIDRALGGADTVLDVYDHGYRLVVAEGP